MVTADGAQHPTDDLIAAIKSYRYLRIGMVLAVVVLFAAILWERSANPKDCFQTSISGYYYTSAQAIFVAGLFVISFGLIVIKGRGVEDIALNIAGVLAPLVAVIPTTDVGKCWREEPLPYPLLSKDPDAPHVFAPWLRDNITNNMRALACGAVAALVLAGLVILLEKKYPGPPYLRIKSSDLASYAVMLAVVLLIVVFVVWRFDDFLGHAHGPAAYTMFGFLALAIATNAWHDRRTHKPYAVAYALIACAMGLTAAVLVGLFQDWDHMVLWLETVEIALFAVFWATQTVQHWRDVGLDTGVSGNTTLTGLT